MDLKQIIEDNGLTMKELADKLGVSTSFLWMVASGKRKMSRALENNLNRVINTTTARDRTTSLSNANIPPALVEHLEVVQANNDLLEQIRKDQERELELKRAQGKQINEALELIQGMDQLVQARVRDIIDERTRTIVAISKHQMHSQALITIAAIEGIINMVEEGITKPSLFLRQLRTVRDQLKEMMNDVKC